MRRGALWVGGVLLAVVATGTWWAARRPHGSPAVEARRGGGRSHDAGYIPIDLDDALNELDAMVSAELKNEVRVSTAPAIRLHFTLGNQIRNRWRLWYQSPLVDWFNARGIRHAESMSALILEAWVARVRGQAYDVNTALAHRQAAQRAEDEEMVRATSAGVAIESLMMGIAEPALPTEWASLPARRNPDGLRVRYMAAFRGGVVLTHREATGAERDRYHTEPFFFDPKDQSLRRILCRGLDLIENAVVAGGRLVLQGTDGTRRRIVSLGPGRRAELPLPPGGDWMRLGLDGEQLLAVFEKSAWRWDGTSWVALGTSALGLPWSGEPPIVHRGTLYLRNESLWQGDHDLHWVPLALNTPTTRFSVDTKLVGPTGPPWDRVWSFAFDSAGNQWIVAGYPLGSLIRRDTNGRYRVAIFNGDAKFTGELTAGSFAATGLNFQGIVATDRGDLVLAGNDGIYRFDGQRMTPVVGLRRARQGVGGHGQPTLTEMGAAGNWHLNPSHVFPWSPSAYLLGSEYAGVYLLDRSPGYWSTVSLDEAIGPPLEMCSPALRSTP